jgi:hypothetical protein
MPQPFLHVVYHEANPPFVPEVRMPQPFLHVVYHEANPPFVPEVRKPRLTTHIITRDHCNRCVLRPVLFDM